MNYELLAVRTAKKFVKNYNDESDALMLAHQEAMDCRDCEDLLQLGIDAFAWIMSADCKVRLALKNGNYEEFESQQTALQMLCRAWLLPCEYAERWIAIQQNTGNKPENQAAFRQCCIEMQAIVKSFEPLDRLEMTAALQGLQDYVLSEFEDDKTVEFL